MGRGLVANYDSEFGSYYNPALTSLGSGVNFNLSHAFLYHRNTDYDYIGIGYADKKFGSFSISRYNWAIGVNESGSYSSHNSIHTLNYSRELAEGFYAGANIELVHMGYLLNYSSLQVGSEGTYDQKSSDAFTMDIGILKKFDESDASDKNILKTFQIGQQFIILQAQRLLIKIMMTLMKDFPLFSGRVSVIM